MVSEVRDNSEQLVKESKITKSGIRALIDEQDERCALTGVKLEPSNASLDHIVPISLGGSHDMSNVHWVRSDVNSAKGVLPMREFIEMCDLVSNHVGQGRWASDSEVEKAREYVIEELSLGDDKHVRDIAQ